MCINAKEQKYRRTEEQKFKSTKEQKLKRAKVRSAGSIL
jgi:hypothetical protein